MAVTCTSCGKQLSFVERLTGRGTCSSCAGSQRQARKDAETEYKLTLSELLSAATPASDIASRLPALAQQAALPERKIRALHLDWLNTYLEQALEDDLLTEQEEARMAEIAKALGIDQETFDSEFEDMKPRLIVAKVNDGRLPTVPNPHIILKKGEVAHAETNAQLLKEVTVREWRGGYSGFSFRIAKGVRYHTGGARGRSVVVGTKLQAQDAGILSVTSRRAVFAGQRRTVEMPYAKLVDLNVFEDGIQFHMSDRKSPPLFKLEKGLGHVIAAVVNGACQQYV